MMYRYSHRRKTLRLCFLVFAPIMFLINDALGLSTSLSHPKGNPSAPYLMKINTLKRSVDIESFEITIDKSHLENLKQLPNVFDFKDVEIWSDLPHQQCRFQIHRRPFHDQRLELMASGNLNIRDGIFDFQSHQWRTNGMSDETYLQDEANLRFSRSGLPVGIIPYFHLFVNQGEVALPPLYVELSDAKEDGPALSLEGSYSFYVDEWQEGIFSISACRAVP